jgi:hypothetical protein
MFPKKRNKGRERKKRLGIFSGKEMSVNNKGIFYS